MVDEKLTTDDTWSPISKHEMRKLVPRIAKINHLCTALTLVDFQPLVQKPEPNPLQVPPKPSRGTQMVGSGVHLAQIRYLQERRANAFQMYEVRNQLWRSWNLADYVNAQRALECRWFSPARSWHYYPIIDTITGTGVPRPIEYMTMLKYPSYAVQIRAKLYEYCTMKRAIRLLNVE